MISLIKRAFGKKKRRIVRQNSIRVGSETNKYVDFVSDAHFLRCVKWVMDAYPTKKSEIDMKKFLNNSLDMFKTVFDIIAGNITVDEWVSTERIRQADKTISNRIGEFHQMLLGGVDGWVDLGRGHPLGIDLKKEDNSIFIELKNKHNTTKGEDKKNVFDKLKRAAEKHKKAIIYYAYIVPKHPRRIDCIWNPSRREPFERIREVGGHRTYELVTGDKNALQKTWIAIPAAVSDLLQRNVKFSASEKAKIVRFFDLTFGQ